MIFSTRKSNINIKYPSLLILGVLINLSYVGALKFGYFNKWTFDSYQFSTVSPAVGVDFFVLYEGGWDFLHGRNMFLRDAGDPREALASGLQRAPYYATFRYIPFYGYTLGVALNLLPPMAAYWFWVFFNEFLLVVNIALTWRISARAGLFELGAFMWLAPFPLFLELWMGQYSLLMASFIFWTAVALMHNKEKTAYLCWYLGVLLKTYTILLIPLWVRLKKFRPIAVCIALVVVTSVPYFLIFPEGFRAFYEKGLRNRIGTGWDQLYLGSMGIQAALQALVHAARLDAVRLQIGDLPFGVGQMLAIVISAATTILLLILTFRKSYHPLSIYCLWAMMFFVLYRDLWEHHYVLLIPVLVLVTVTNVINVWTAVIIFLLVGTPTYFAILNAPESAAALRRAGIYDILYTLYFLIKPAGVVLLFISMILRGQKMNPQMVGYWGEN
jgi:hypothetical protein